MATPAQRRSLAPGLEVSRIVTGLWQIADMERDGRLVDRPRAVAAMRPYLDAGLTTFDMADHYGSAEEIVGAFRAADPGRDALQILTKWVPEPGPVTREGVRAAVERSLGRLRAQTIDLLQFHAWAYWDPVYLDCLFWLHELQSEGLIRHLGLTNFDTSHLRLVLASGIPVVSNQVSYSLLDQRARGPMSELCVEHDVGLLAYGTLAGGLLTERWLGRPDTAADAMGSWSEMKYRRFLGEAGGWSALQNLLAVLDRVARRLESSIANVASRYILDQPGVAAVIIGARLGQSEHIEANLRLFETVLDDESRSEIERALAALEPIPGDCGDEYRRPPYLTASGDLSHHFDAFPAPYPATTSEDGRRRVSSGTPWEAYAGYSRAVREGRRIRVSGTTATHGERVIGGDDPAAQTHFVIDKIEGALRSLGGRLEDVVRTRIYLPSISDWEVVARAHGARFGAIRPANTLVEARLIGDRYRVEIEAEAVVPENRIDDDGRPT